MIRMMVKDPVWWCIGLTWLFIPMIAMTPADDYAPVIFSMMFWLLGNLIHLVKA